jgi:hypothetical protein
LVSLFSEGRIRPLNGWDFEKGDFQGYVTKIGFSLELKAKRMDFYLHFPALFPRIKKKVGSYRK